VVNGTVQDVVRQVAAFQAGDTFNGNDLVLIWVGMHDILDDYAANATGDEGVLLGDMRSAGSTLADLVNAVADAGGKVMLLTVPDMSQSPFAYLEAQRGGFDRLKLLSDMSTNFNLGLRTRIVNDGSRIGLVEVDTIVRDDVRNPAGAGLIADANAVVGCIDAAPVPTCSTDTLNDDPATGPLAPSAILWADATHLGSTAQGQIGKEAVRRAHGNPF
jgi:phospholipase/lecithinase/hemolysin